MDSQHHRNGGAHMAELKSLTLNESKYDSFVDRTARSAIETLTENLPDSGISAEEVRQILADFLEEHPIPSTGGLDSAAAALLIDILQCAAYGTDVSHKIERLRSALGSDGGNTEAPEVITYTITNTLTNVTTDNPVSDITAGAGYTAVLSPADGCQLGSVTVTMGGVDVTASVYASGIVNIGTVTGDVIITATAEANQEPQPPAYPTQVAYLQTDGASYIDTGYCLKAKDGFELRCDWGDNCPKSPVLGARDDITKVYITKQDWYLRISLSSNPAGSSSDISGGNRITIETLDNITIKCTGGTTNNYMYLNVFNADGTEVYNSAAANTGDWYDMTAPMYLFAFNDNGTPNFMSSGFKIRGFA